MAIVTDNLTNFIPELWTAELDQVLRATLVYGQAGIVNRDYEGTISRFGDTVHVPYLNDVSVADYAATGSLDYEDLAGDVQTMTIDKAKAWGFRVDDIERAQALPEYRGRAAQVAGRKLAEAVDGFLAGLMAAGVASGNVVTGASGALTASGAVDNLLKLKTALDNANVPAAGRFVVVSPNYEAMLLRSDLFIDAASRGDQSGRVNGEVGGVFGFRVLSTTSIAKNSTKEVVIAGHPMATSFAEQLLETESLRDVNRFADLVRGLLVYGGKVFHGEALAKVEVTYA